METSNITTSSIGTVPYVLSLRASDHEGHDADILAKRHRVYRSREELGALVR